MSTTVDLPIDDVVTAAERLAALMWDCDVAIADDEFTHAQWMVGYYPADLQPVFRRLSIRHRDTRPVLSVRVDDTLTASELGVVLHALYSVEPITTPEWKIPFRIEDQTYVLTISREHTFRVDEEGKDAVNDGTLFVKNSLPSKPKTLPDKKTKRDVSTKPRNVFVGDTESSISAAFRTALLKKTPSAKSRS